MISFLRKVRWRLGRPNKETELEQELRFHLEEEAAEPRRKVWQVKKRSARPAGNWETSPSYRRTHAPRGRGVKLASGWLSVRNAAG